MMFADLDSMLMAGIWTDYQDPPWCMPNHAFGNAAKQKFALNRIDRAWVSKHETTDPTFSASAGALIPTHSNTSVSSRTGEGDESADELAQLFPCSIIGKAPVAVKQSCRV